MKLSRAAAPADLGDAGTSETGRLLGALTVEDFSKTLVVSYVEEFSTRRFVRVGRVGSASPTPPTARSSSRSGRASATGS